jgi:hypothetical protein
MSVLEFKNRKAPLARKKIAHRFIGGSRQQTETSPARDGRKWFSRLLSSLTGLIAFWDIIPTVETMGYCPSRRWRWGKFTEQHAIIFFKAKGRQKIAHRFIGGLTEL